MAGYDATILGICDEADFECGVCHKVVNDAVHLNCCEYQYCFKCYTDSIWRKLYDLCASKQRQVFEQKRKKEAEDAEKKHALAIARYASDIDEFKKEIDRCKAEIKLYQMVISKKDISDFSVFSDEDQPAKKRKTDILDAQKSDKKKSINVSTDVPIESTPTVDNNNQNSSKTNLISTKKEPCLESLHRPIKREPNDSVLYFEGLISRVKHKKRRGANKQKSKKRVSFSNKPLSVRLIPPNPPRPALAPEVYVALPAAPVSKKRKTTSTRKRKATDEKSKATKSNIARKTPIVPRRSSRIRAQKIGS